MSGVCAGNPARSAVEGSGPDSLRSARPLLRKPTGPGVTRGR